VAAALTPEKRQALEARILDLARGTLDPMPRKPHVTIETLADHYRVRLWRTAKTRGLALLELHVPIA
jgi:hypothetical protein